MSWRDRLRTLRDRVGRRGEQGRQRRGGERQADQAEQRRSRSRRVRAAASKARGRAPDPGQYVGEAEARPLRTPTQQREREAEVAERAERATTMGDPFDTTLEPADPTGVDEFARATPAEDGGGGPTADELATNVGDSVGDEPLDVDDDTDDGLLDFGASGEERGPADDDWGWL